MRHPPLDREEYVEQAYFFRTFRERLNDNIPAQEILLSVQQEILATTRLPMAIEFLRGEVLLTGMMSEGMARLPHYFAPFQTFVVSVAEQDRGRFEQRMALEILQHEAAYRAATANPVGLFVYQFECMSRNRLGYDRGLAAMMDDPLYDDRWSAWIRRARLKLGDLEFPDLIYQASDQYVTDRRRITGQEDFVPKHDILFGAKEGRIAQANRGRDPLYMFAALQRHLGYPEVPRTRINRGVDKLIIDLQAHIAQLEKRLLLVESELKGQLDISKFYVDKPPELPNL